MMFLTREEMMKSIARLYPFTTHVDDRNRKQLILHPVHCSLMLNTRLF
jgi:hypothetical protein